MSVSFGLDVSEYQGSDIKWPVVASEGFSFVGIKAGGSSSTAKGSLYLDPGFVSNVSGATSAGFVVVAYWYLSDNSGSAESQMAAFLGQVSRAGLDLSRAGLVIDVEDSSLAGKYDVVESALNYLYSHKSISNVGVYTSKYNWVSKLRFPSSQLASGKRPWLWEAHWLAAALRWVSSSSLASQQFLGVPDFWWKADYGLWPVGHVDVLQFSDHALVGSKFVDVDASLLPVDEFRAMIRAVS